MKFQASKTGLDLSITSGNEEFSKNSPDLTKFIFSLHAVQKHVGATFKPL